MTQPRRVANRQLRLSNPGATPPGPPPTHHSPLDDRTREIGRRGVALARAALRQADAGARRAA